jgi:hypothetical protein
MRFEQPRAFDGITRRSIHQADALEAVTMPSMRLRVREVRRIEFPDVILHDADATAAPKWTDDTHTSRMNRLNAKKRGEA